MTPGAAAALLAMSTSANRATAYTFLAEAIRRGLDPDDGYHAMQTWEAANQPQTIGDAR